MENRKIGIKKEGTKYMCCNMHCSMCSIKLK